MAYAATATPRTKIIYTPASTALLLECVESFGPIAGTKSTSEWTALSGLTGKSKSGKPDWQAIPFSLCAFDPIDPSHVGLFTALNSATPAAKVWAVGTTLPGTNPELGFSAFIANLKLSIPNEGWVTLSGSVQPTTGFTAQVATAVTPSISLAPIRAEGVTLALYVTNAFSQIKGLVSMEIDCGTVGTISGGATDATVVGKYIGYRSNASGSFVIEYDNSEANHTALKTAYETKQQQDQLQVTLTDADSSTITLNPVEIVSWDGDFASKSKTNQVKVGFIANCDVAIVTPEA